MQKTDSVAYILRDRSRSASGQNASAMSSSPRHHSAHNQKRQLHESRWPSTHVVLVLSLLAAGGWLLTGYTRSGTGNTDKLNMSKDLTVKT
eukprot:6088109-Pyramimonas_sp.AAC.1